MNNDDIGSSIKGAKEKSRRTFLGDYATAAKGFKYNNPDNNFELKFIPRDKVDDTTKQKLSDIVAQIEGDYYYLQLCLRKNVIKGLAYPRLDQERIQVTFYWINSGNHKWCNMITKRLQPELTQLVAQQYRESNKE